MPALLLTDHLQVSPKVEALLLPPPLMVITCDEVSRNPRAAWIFPRAIGGLTVNTRFEHGSSVDSRNVAIHDVAGVENRCDPLTLEQVILRVQCVETRLLAAKVSIRDETDFRPLVPIEHIERNFTEGQRDSGRFMHECLLYGDLSAGHAIDDRRSRRNGATFTSVHLFLMHRFDNLIQCPANEFRREPLSGSPDGRLATVEGEGEPSISLPGFDAFFKRFNL